MIKPIPTEMRAIEIAQPGDASVLREVWRPVLGPGPGEVLLRVIAAGVNRPDVLQRQGFYPPPAGASDIPGLEISGEVVALGHGVTRARLGDQVVALVAGGGYAEYCVAPEGQTLPIPSGIDPVEAAGIPETFFTVWTNVFERGGLLGGQSLLVHGGSSGIGTTAIQLAVAMGADVYTTAGTPEKCKACESLGALRAVNYKTEDFVEVLNAETNGRGVDVVLDMVGGDYVPRNLELLREEGRHVSIAFMRGPSSQVNLMTVMQKRLVLTGSTLRSRAVAEKTRLAQAVHKAAWPLLESGRVRVIVDERFELSQAVDAHRRMESSEHVGKIILEVTTSTEPQLTS